MFIDGEDDENSIATGFFLFVFRKKYMAPLPPPFCSSITETLALGAAQPQWDLVWSHLQRREMNESGCTVQSVLNLITGIGWNS